MKGNQALNLKSKAQFKHFEHTNHDHKNLNNNNYSILLNLQVKR